MNSTQTGPTIQVVENWSIPSSRPAQVGEVARVGKPSDGKLAFASGPQIIIFDSGGNSLCSWGGPYSKIIAFGTDAVVAHRPWGQQIDALSLEGKKIWSKDFGKDSVDDIALARFRRGKKGLVVGFNGDGGVTLLDGKAQELWNAKENLGNVWHVAAFRRKGRSEDTIAATNESDGFRLFDVSGDVLADINEAPVATVFGVGDLLQRGFEQLITICKLPLHDGDTASPISVYGDGLRLIPRISNRSGAYNLAPVVANLFGHANQLVAGNQQGLFSFFDSSGQLLLEWQAPEKKVLSFCSVKGVDGLDRIVVLTPVSLTCYSVTPTA